MKRLLLILLAIMLLAALPLQTFAAHVSGAEAADALAALGLLQGTGGGYRLERSATRAEAVTLLLRLLGREGEALAETDACPFEDGGWAAPQLTYARKLDLVKGRSETYFGSAEPVSSRDWLTMLLRVLGYSDAAGDFTWRESIAFADSIGLCHGEYTADGAFLREDMALTTYTALTLPMKDGARTLIEQLYQDGVVSGASLRTTRLGFAVPTDKAEYNAMEIHERCASAVVLVELYNDEEALAKDKPDGHGSGFFITGDGVAAMCYHEIDDCAYARVTTLDGRRYDVTGVLHYDPLWDTAVVRVSRTDLEGETVRFFPYLDLGDSDAVCAGEPVYTLSNALGRVDNITEGLISNRSREVDDPDYLSIQTTAAISPGSSGGALVNRFGETIGILYGAFANGSSMNLAVPVNVISSVDLTDDGVPLTEVKETESANKAAATLNASQTELELTYGEAVEVLVTHTAPGTASMRYKCSARGIVDCTWGSFITKHTAPLTIEAVGDGDVDITISFVDDCYSEEHVAVIHVTVTGTPEEPEEELPSGTTDE